MRQKTKLAGGLPSSLLPICSEPTTGRRRFAYGLTGGAERWLKIPLDLSRPPVTYAAQAFQVVQRTPIVRFFGPKTGFIVNFTFDRAVRFDLAGQPTETLTRAYRPGDVTLCMRGRSFSAESLKTIAAVCGKIDARGGAWSPADLQLTSLH
jgi:hypothetical protein